MSILKEWQTMKVEIVSYSDKYSNYFYDLNHDWLSEFFYVEEYDEKVLKHCKEELIGIYFVSCVFKVFKTKN